MDLFHVTIGWDGYDDLTEGQISFHRDNFQDALFGANYYLEKYKDREAYVVCASHEEAKSIKNITDIIKDSLTNNRSQSETRQP